MPPPFPFGVTVMVQRSTADRHGDRTFADHHTLPGCAVAPRTSTEDTDRRNAVIVGLSLYAQFDADIRATDRIVLPNGDAYEVEGVPGSWGPHPMTGWSPGIEVALRRVEG